MWEETKNGLRVLTLKFNSDWFECTNPKYKYKEMRQVLGDISNSPCPNCGKPIMRCMK